MILLSVSCCTSQVKIEHIKIAKRKGAKNDAINIEDGKES